MTEKTNESGMAQETPNNPKAKRGIHLIDIVVGSIVLIVLIVVFIPQVRMQPAKQWSEARLEASEIGRQYYSFNKWVGPQYQEVEVYYAKSDIWEGQVIKEENVSTEIKRLFSEAIIGELYPSKQDIVGTKASELILAGSQFSKLNLKRTKFTARERKGHYSKEEKDHIF